MISVRDFEQFSLHHYKNSELRLGQDFCNTFGVTNNGLFYQTDDKKAIQMIYDEYIAIER
jgi:hypothetical protein